MASVNLDLSLPRGSYVVANHDFRVLWGYVPSKGNLVLRTTVNKDIMHALRMLNGLTAADPEYLFKQHGLISRLCQEGLLVTSCKSCEHAPLVETLLQLARALGGLIQHGQDLRITILLQDSWLIKARPALEALDHAGLRFDLRPLSEAIAETLPCAPAAKSADLAEIRRGLLSSATLPIRLQQLNWNARCQAAGAL